MIENFSEEGIQLIIEELKDKGYLDSHPGKITLWREAKEKTEITDDQIPNRLIRDASYMIADVLTGNVTKDKECRSRYVDKDIIDEYQGILTDLLKAIKPHLNGVSSDERKD